MDRTAGIDEADRRNYGPVALGERRKFSEGTIKPEEKVYVFGAAREAADWDGSKFVIDEPTADGDFILSNKSEGELIKEGKRGGLVFLVFGGILVLAGTMGMIVPWVSV